MWVSIQQVAKMYAKPERTLRHYAAQGKIIVRKKNRNWECSLASVEKLGWSQVKTLPPSPMPGDANTKDNLIENPDLKNPENKSEHSSNKGLSKETKRFVLSNLGVYQELLEITKNLKKNLTGHEDWQILFESAFKSIQYIGYGFYCFDKASKIQYFGQARNQLINLLVHIEVGSETNEVLEIKKQLEDHILPGLGGLIRRSEKTLLGKNNGQNTRSTNFTKN